MNQKHIALLIHLNHLVFGVPRDQQLGAMKRVLDTATEQDITIRGAYGDSTDAHVVPKIWKVSPADIRRLLTDPRLTKANRYNEAHDYLFYGCRPKTISQAAHAFTMKFFGMSLRDYLKAARDGEVDGIPQEPFIGKRERQFVLVTHAEMFEQANGFPDIFPDSWSDEVREFTEKDEPSEDERQNVSDIFHTITFECGEAGLTHWLRLHKIAWPERLAA